MQNPYKSAAIIMLGIATLSWTFGGTNSVVLYNIQLSILRSPSAQSPWGGPDLNFPLTGLGVSSAEAGPLSGKLDAETRGYLLS